MVEVTLQRITKPIFLKAWIIVVVPDLHRPIGRQQFTARIGLEAQHGFKQQRVPHPTHALNRRTIGGTV